MKLFATAVLFYIANIFGIPIALEALAPYIWQPPIAGFLQEPLVYFIAFTIFPTALLSAVSTYLYARWARIGLDVGRNITVAAAYLAVPAIMYLLWLGVSFFENPVIAVDEMQEFIIPLFEGAEQGHIFMLLEKSLGWILYAIPFLMGPMIASFFVKEQAVEQARIIL